MPGPSYGARPEDILTQLLQTPVSAPNQPEVQSEYADRPAQEAIRAYLATGKMPTTMRAQPSGAIGSILQGVGLQGKTQAVLADVQNRAILAGQQRQNEEAARKISEIMGLGGYAQQFGGAAGQKAMQVADPQLAGAFDPTLKGKGDIAQEQTDIKLQQMIGSQDIKDREAGAKELYYQTQLARQQGNTDRMLQLMDIHTKGLKLQQDKLSLEQQKFEEAPHRAVGEAHLKSLDAQEQGIYKQINSLTDISGDPVGEDDPRVKRLNKRLAEIQAEREKWIDQTYAGAGKAPAATAAPTKPATAAAPTTGTYTPLKTGVFGGGGGG